jgi:galactokinase
MTTAVAPGRVNLIGEHTDTTGGLALPMAIGLGTTVDGVRGGDRVRLRSATEPIPLDLPLRIDDPSATAPPWGRYVAGVIAELEPDQGFDGTVTTTLPIGAGLSSSAALEVAVALALGFDGSARDLATLCQRAERHAVGVPCGVMDQLTSVCGVSGQALLLDCGTLDVTPVPLPEGLEVVAVHSGEHRELVGSTYAERRAAVEAAEVVVGPLRALSDMGTLDLLDDPVLRRRARHVVTENQRVRDAVLALRAEALGDLGELLAASHASLATDFEVSTPRLDALVRDLRGRPGVFGARLTGAGFGGCAVALCRPGALDVGWRLVASDGARLDD